jgi:hypothetical protein
LVEAQLSQYHNGQNASSSSRDRMALSPMPGGPIAQLHSYGQNGPSSSRDRMSHAPSPGMVEAQSSQYQFGQNVSSSSRDRMAHSPMPGNSNEAQFMTGRDGRQANTSISRSHQEVAPYADEMSANSSRVHMGDDAIDAQLTQTLRQVDRQAYAQSTPKEVPRSRQNQSYRADEVAQIPSTPPQYRTPPVISPDRYRRPTMPETYTYGGNIAMSQGHALAIDQVHQLPMNMDYSLNVQGDVYLPYPDVHGSSPPSNPQFQNSDFTRKEAVYHDDSRLTTDIANLPESPPPLNPMMAATQVQRKETLYYNEQSGQASRTSPVSSQAGTLVVDMQTGTRVVEVDGQYIPATIKSAPAYMHSGMLRFFVSCDYRITDELVYGFGLDADDWRVGTGNLVGSVPARDTNHRPSCLHPRY